MKKTMYIQIMAWMLCGVSCHHSSLEYDASGLFEATEVVVSSQSNGELKRLDIDEGMRLEPGLCIGLVDTTQLHLQKEQLIAAKRGVENRRMDVSIQLAALIQQIETQEQEQKRFENLLRSNAANKKQLDDIESNIRYLKKQLAAQQETVNNTNSSLSDESISINLQIAQIEEQIKNAQISSPIEGTVLAKYAVKGELASIGKPLFKVANIKLMYLRAYVTSSQLSSIKIGQEVKVYADNSTSSKMSFSGQISWISDKAEFTPKTIQTRDERANLVYAIKVSVANSEGMIKNGMYGEVEF